MDDNNTFILRMMAIIDIIIIIFSKDGMFWSSSNKIILTTTVAKGEFITLVTSIGWSHNHRKEDKSWDYFVQPRASTIGG